MSKTKIIDMINTTYDEDDLHEIFTIIEQRLIEVQNYQSKTKDIPSILKTVKQEGYICLTQPIEIKDQDILSIDLYANVYVYTFGEVNKEDLVIDHLTNNTGTWVEELDFDCICDYDQLILPKNSQEWDYGDYGDPYNSIAKFKVQVLYLQKDFPGESFRYIDLNGLIKTMIVKDEKLYTDDKYFGDVDKWDTYKLFVL